MSLVVCPYCGPESLCYSGRIISRTCDSCRDTMRLPETDRLYPTVAEEREYRRLKEKYGL